MSGRASNEDGGGDDGALPSDAGLDAKLDRAVPSDAAEAFLVGVAGIHGGRVFPLSHNTSFIGRSEDLDVVIADPSVSSRHARLINGSHGFEIEDLGSRNGTYVEGRRVTRAGLQSGDRVAIGQVEFKFLVDRRIDATMTIIPPAQPRRVQQQALVPIERPRPDPGAGPRFVPRGRQDQDEEEGPSLEELIGRLALMYKFVERNALLIGAFVGVGAVLGLISMVLLPAAREAVCVLKLQPDIKTNPVDAQWNRSENEDHAMRFFEGAETAFVQPELVGKTLKKLLGRTPDDGMVNSLAPRFKLESQPDHVYRATYREKLMGNGPSGPAEFLAAHLETYLRGEIDRAIRVFTAQADFLRDQLKTVEGEMKKISDQKMQFSQTNSDRLPEEAGQMLGSRFDLETKRAELMAEVRRLQGELDAQRHALSAEGPLAQNRLHSSQVYRDSLADVNRKLTEAYARGLAEGHPEVRQLKDEKERLDALIQKEMKTETSALDRSSNAGYQEQQTRVALLQAQLGAARSNLGDTERSLGHVQSVVGDLPRVQAGVAQLTHMQEATTALHGQLFEQLKKAELQLNLERVSAESRYEVVSAPHIVKSNLGFVALVRAIVGAVMGLFLALAVVGVRKGSRIFSQALSNLETAPRTTRR
jgi:pSer/pThr/pTyr-binding forkhead associated (FHA) protein